MPRYLGIARNSKGDAIPSPTIYIYDAGTSTLSTIYTEETLTTTESNPLTGDSDGTYEFYASPGEYKLKITKAGYADFEEDDIVIGEYADAYSVSGDNSGALIGSAGIFYHTTSPEGVVTANPGSMCLTSESSVGKVYIKVTGTSNTGWSQL